MAPPDSSGEQQHAIESSVQDAAVARDELYAKIGGIACRLPKSDNVQEFWENLMGKVDMLSPTRWPKGMYGIPPRAGLLANYDRFDAAFFGIPEEEASNMCSALYLLLEVIHECIVDSGLSIDVLRKKKTGLYLAIAFNEEEAVITTSATNSHYLNIKSEFLNRIFSVFELNGPAAAVDSACSSSINALQMGVMDLNAERCDYVIVAGVNLILSPQHTLQFFKLGMLSPTGDSHPFDASANGYVRSEGVVAMLLSCRSPLKRRYAGIHDVLCLSEGYKEEGILHPSKNAQVNLLSEIYENQEACYVETHGTGTKIGDATEISALAEALCQDRKCPLLVGSVKSNMGHSEACSGLVNLLKCVLIIHHRMIPPTIHYKNPNPQVDTILGSTIKVVTEPTRLPGGTIGVSNFGFGGAIAHVILKRTKNPCKQDLPKTILLPLQMRDRKHCDVLFDFTKSNRKRPDVLSLLSTSFLSRYTRGAYTGYISLVSDELKMKSVSYEGSEPVWLILHDALLTDTSRMNKNIFHIKFIHDCFLKYDSALADLGCSTSLITLLATVIPSIRFKDKLLLFIGTLMAYVDMLETCKFQAAGICGYGLAEIVVAYADGCIDYIQCLQIVNLIGEHLESPITCVDGPGEIKTLEVRLPVEKVLKLSPHLIVLAVINGDTCYVRVPFEHVNVLGNIHSQGGFYKELRSDIPVYSSECKRNMGKLMTELKLVFQPRERSDRWFSSSGASQSTNRSFDTKYIYNILTRRVDFPALHAWLPQGVKVHLNGDGRRKLVWDADEDIYWSPDCSSVVSALGELYLLTKNEHFGKVNPDVFPLDSSASPIGHLVSWDHSIQWPVPTWPQFCISEKSVLQRDFFIRHETNDCYDAISVLLFEIIDLLALDLEIFGGRFTSRIKRLVRFEILWQDNYLDFINTVFDYGYSHFRSDLTGVIFDPAKHRVELEKQCSLLAIIELETGICQSGGIVLKFCLLKNGPDIEEIKSPYTEDLLMHSILVYDITKQTAGNVMVLYASGTESRKRYLVVSLSTEEIIFQKRIEIDQSVKPKHMVQVLPYLLSHYVLHSVLQLEKNQTLLIQPPYDPMSIFIAEMASNLCQRVYVSSWSVEQSVDLMEMLPEITVMWGVLLTNNLLSRTHGHGCDAVIKFIGNDINAAFLNLADNGKLVLFGSPDPTESLGLGVFLKNITFLVTEPLDAVSEFLKADDSSLDSDLVNGILNPKFLKHLEDGLLEEKSSLYSLIHSFEFKSLVSLKRMLTYLKDFEVKPEYFEYLDSDTKEMFEKIKNTLGPTLKKHFQSPINLNDTAFATPTQTLTPTQTISASQKSVSTPIIVITPSPNEDFTAENVYDGSSNEAENGDESDLHVAQNVDGISPLQQPVTDTAEESFSMKRTMEARGKNFPPFLKLVSLHSETLLVLSPSRHELSPNIHELMKARRIKANLEPLNSVEGQERPLFIVHPITGVVSLLKPLGQALSVPCFGIKMTDGTPRTSVTEMASFYISVLEAAYPKGPYRLAGYSFGACIALEMALQLQASNRVVECLILVDGSPDYVHAHCNLIRREIPTDCTQKLLSELMDLGYLLTFIEMYKPKCKDSKALLRSSLLKLNDTESRLEWTVDYLLGKSIASPLPAKKNWLMASFKMMEKKKEQPLVSTTHEVLRISRTEKARDFLRNCRIGYEYMTDKRYYGCIHFMRIKDEPRNAFPLPSDYGLSKFCDDLTIRYYDGDHLTVMNDATMALDIENILKNL